ncbi:hypothetical protein EV44_g2441 [Erysiphe necator]|uniref:Uncharacterized protein n=1 Tax=Uncinula necator TaxID=52586 RepID=A0A0B1PBD5_UNCNE|nr:hypothetical protein EV44_g2441 [Erysiphe necator]
MKRKDETNDEYNMRLERYNDRNDAAHSAILNGVSDDLQELACSFDEELESARVAMRLLKDKYDYETTTSTIQLFKEFSELKMAEGDLISHHITQFETAYSLFTLVVQAPLVLKQLLNGTSSRLNKLKLCTCSFLSLPLIITSLIILLPKKLLGSPM